MTHNPIADALANLTRNQQRTARQAAAKTTDSRTIRASWRAGRGSRSIGVTRTPFGE